MDQERGVQLDRICVDQNGHFMIELCKQIIWVNRSGHDVADLLLSLHRLRKRTQVQTDHDLFDPTSREGLNRIRLTLVEVRLKNTRPDQFLSTAFMRTKLRLPYLGGSTCTLVERDRRIVLAYIGTCPLWKPCSRVSSLFFLICPFLRIRMRREIAER